jgi:AraC-like DNA-binding protein
MEEHADLGSARDIGLFSLLVGLRQLSTTMTGRELGRFVTDIPLARPAYFHRFAHLLPGARFGKPQACIHFSARALDVPLAAPDRAALRLAREVCERQLEELGFERHLPSRVLRLAVTPERVRGMDEVAHELRLSTRTLKRKLAAEGVSFSELVDRERRVRSFELLRSELTLEEIAHRLDYSSLPNFARAFRRWTGETPARYRRRQRADARGA